jgi:hypothetical protein
MTTLFLGGEKQKEQITVTLLKMSLRLVSLR